MTTEAAPGRTTADAEIRTLMDDREKAVRARDVMGSMAHIAPDILSFDVVNPLQRIGAEALRTRAKEWFASLVGPIGYETHDLSITASHEVAFCHGLSHVSATRTDGEKPEMWWRTTMCFRRIEGNWMVTHEHNSVPFDVESGKASLDLKP